MNRALEKIAFSRVTTGPFINPKNGTLAEDAVTTPDVLFSQGEYVLYLGSVSYHRERIISQTLNLTALFSGESMFTSMAAKIVIEPGTYPYESQHVFDPAAIIVDDRIFLFYSAIGSKEDSIGLAISDDYINFQKMEHPILPGRSPEIYSLEDKLYLYFVKKSNRQGYQIYMAKLNISAELKEMNTNPVLGSGPDGAWDHFEVTTPRIFERHGIFYMTYAGSNQIDRADLPIGFGLARSFDLINWEKYPLNPIFQIGAPGNWDDGALWFGTVFEVAHHLFLLYEGIGSVDMNKPPPQFSKVGLATIGCDEFDQLIDLWR